MADFGGGIPGQVVSELVSIPKQVVETVVSAPPQTQNNPSADDSVIAAKDVAAKRRLAQVRGELQEYYEQQKKKEEHEEVMAEEQKTQEKKQIEVSKKKQEEDMVLQRLSSQYGGTGEVAKSGN